MKTECNERESGEFMAHADKQIRGTAWHVQDCQVWAEIQYLDSPSDYQECLAGTFAGPERTHSQLVFLDDLKLSGWLISSVLVIGFFLLVSVGYFLYLLLGLI